MAIVWSYGRTQIDNFKIWILEHNSAGYFTYYCIRLYYNLNIEIYHSILSLVVAANASLVKSKYVSSAITVSLCNRERRLLEAVIPRHGRLHSATADLIWVGTE